MSDREHAEARNLLHRGLGRVEFYDLTPKALNGLANTLEHMAAEGRPRFSFHAPLIRPPYYPYPAVFQFFLNEDAAKRELNFRALEHTLSLAKEWKADYVVTHLTFGGTDTGDEATAERLARDSCARIAGLSRTAGVPVDIEFAAYTDSFHHPRGFADAVAPHDELGLCLDVGHTYIGSILRDRDFFSDLATLAPQARSLHLWNTKGPSHFKDDPHTPLHPSQKAGDGWIDLERALGTILDIRPVANVIFEYPVETVGERIREGYDWAASLLGRPP